MSENSGSNVLEELFNQKATGQPHSERDHRRA